MLLLALRLLRPYPDTVVNVTMVIMTVLTAEQTAECEDENSCLKTFTEPDSK